MGINDLIVIIVIIFLCLGAIDYLIGDKLGLGEHFAEGIKTMGPLALAMVGIISLAPVLANLLTPIIAPMYSWIGADPASFANMILAIDMGGYSLAQEMGLTKEAATFSWVFLGTMMGPTIAFTIPVAIGIINKNDQPYFAQGIMIGIMTIPVGCIIGGLTAQLDFFMMVKNLIPPMMLSIVIAVGLWKIPSVMIAGFQIFAKGIEGLAIIGLACIVVEAITGLVLIPNMLPLEEGLVVVGNIAVFLAGAFPLVAVISKVLDKFLKKAGKFLRVNETAMAGFAASLAHVIPMLAILKDMDARGKVMNVAFAVSGGFVLGSHLGFVAGYEREMAFALMVGKLSGGVSALLLASFLLNRTKPNTTFNRIKS